MPTSTQIYRTAKMIVKQPRKYPADGFHDGFSTTEISIMDEKGREVFCLTLFSEIVDGVHVLVHSGCPATVEA